MWFLSFLPFSLVYSYTLPESNVSPKTEALPARWKESAILIHTNVSDCY